MAPIKMPPIKIDEESYDDYSFAGKAARASLIAPFIAFGINIFAANLEGDPTGARILVISSYTIVITGLIFSIIGLCGVKKSFLAQQGWLSLLCTSILGLSLNLGPILFTLYLFFISPLLTAPEGSRLAKAMKEDSETKLTITPPAGFQKLSKLSPGTSHAFYKPGNHENELGIWFIIINLDGMVKPKEDQYLKNTYKNSDLPGEVTFFTENWKGHTIEIARTEMTNPNFVFEDNELIPIVSFDALLPTAPKAMIIKINGMLSKEKEIKKYLKEAIIGIDGPTNW